MMMYDSEFSEDSEPKINEKKSGRSINVYATYETFVWLHKFTNYSRLINTAVRSATAELATYFNQDGDLSSKPGKYDENDKRFQLFEYEVAARRYAALRANPTFFDGLSQKSAEMELEELWDKLRGGAKFQRKPRRGRALAVASVYGMLFSLVAIGSVCALAYLYIYSPALPDLEEYYVLVPVLASTFLLVSSSLRAICLKALGTLSNKLGKKLI